LNNNELKLAVQYLAFFTLSIKDTVLVLLFPKLLEKNTKTKIAREKNPNQYTNMRTMNVVIRKKQCCGTGAGRRRIINMQFARILNMMGLRTTRKKHFIALIHCEELDDNLDLYCA
jgi:hypothetical protein